MKRKYSPVKRKNQINGILFTSPALLGLLLWTAYPVGASLYYSFCNYSSLKPPVWIGMANYRQMLHDPILIQSLFNTMYFAIISVPLGIAVAFLLALLLNQKVKGLALFRTLFYLPSIVPAIASTAMWLWIFNPQYGILNGVLRSVGISGPGWLLDPAWSKPALILMSTWGIGGWMVIFLAGLQDVPQELHDAASVDGASALQRVRHITVPFMSSYIFFAAVMGLIGASQYFTQAYVLTNGTGAPANSTMFFALYLFQNAFHFFKMGYACAMAWLLFLLVLGSTILVFKSSARYVYYPGDAK